MALVTCVYCKDKFDKAKQAYIQIPAGTTFRHAHASCYLRKKLETPNITEYVIIDPTNFVKCCYCKQQIDKSKDQYQQISNSRYAHELCVQKETLREKTDEEKLEAYIKSLYGLTYVPPLTRKQINSYIEEYDYTYSGILKSLQYHYEIKRNEIDPSYGYSIAIVPYVYEHAKAYYYSLWLAQQVNENKDITQYTTPVVKVIKAKPPTCKIRKKKKFQFLDEEE